MVCAYQYNYLTFVAAYLQQAKHMHRVSLTDHSIHCTQMQIDSIYM